MLIESDKRLNMALNSLILMKNSIPPNVHVLGMMNTADRSLAVVDYALRRRFRFFNIEPHFGDKFRKHLAELGTPNQLIEKIVDRIKALNKTIAKEDKNLGKGFCVGHSYFCPPTHLSRPDNKWYEAVIKHEIKPLLEEYWFDDLDKAEDQSSRLL